MGIAANRKMLTSLSENVNQSGEVADASTSKLWYAVYTIVRHEKSVNAMLLNLGVESYLPLREVTAQWKDRRKKLQVPLFPGYMFVRIFENDTPSILRVLNTRGVIRILSTNGSYENIPAEQIDSIRLLLEKNIEFDPYEYFVKGKEVQVVNGPLQGVNGKIIERKGQNRLIVSIDIIKRSVAVEVDPADVELV